MRRPVDRFVGGFLVAVLLGGCGWLFGGKTPKAGSALNTSPEPGPRELFAALPSQAGPALDSDEVVDRVVAVVNNEAITLTDLLEGVAYFLYEAPRAVSPSQERTLKERILQRMVERRLQLQEAQREGVMVEETEVTGRLAEVMKRMGVKSSEEMEEIVAAQGLTIEAVRKRLREQIMVQKVIRRKVALRVSVTESEIDRYLEENRDKLETGLTFQARHIMIVPAARTESGWEAARAQAEEIWAMVQDGKDFSELARNYSMDPSAREGGDLGVLKQGELAPEIEARVIGLEPEEVTPPFRTDLGYHLFRLEWKESLTGEALEQTKRQIRDILFRQKYEARLKEWLEEIKRRAVIEIRL
ncbi:MAG: peptidylprolyl isomerase [Candidatus Methylomirabilia bacterium]